MPESFVQVAPNSTGSKLHTRQRTVGANTVDEQYVIIQNEAVPSNRVWLSTLRVPARALAPTAPAVATQPMFAIFNGITTGGNSLSIRRFSVEVDSVAVSAVASPILRLYRTAAAPGSTTGTAVVPVQQYSADPAFSASVSIRADHGTDAVVAGTALTQTIANTNPMWSQTVPRMHTAAGFQVVTEYNLVPNDSQLMAQDPLILRPQEGCAVRLESTTAVAAAAFTCAFKVVLAEFTYP